jgi:hypothetical protein
MSERVDLDGDGDGDLPRFETIEGFRRCRLLLSFKARSSGAGRMFQIGCRMEMMSAASPVYSIGGSVGVVEASMSSWGWNKRFSCWELMECYLDS